MKEGQKLWTQDELVLALNLYTKLEFGKMHSRNPAVIELGRLINRTPGSVAFKLVNFASLDPELKKRGIAGAKNSGSLDRHIWNEFKNDWDTKFEESEVALAKLKRTSLDKLYNIDVSDINLAGKEKERLIKTRVNQYRFRQMVLANYNSTCCITGIKQPQLLIASHITEWSKYENNRLNPMNGLCLNALHDRAFDNFLITISAEEYKIIISHELKKQENKNIQKYFLHYEGKKIMLPKKFLPGADFLKIHNDSFYDNLKKKSPLDN